MTSDVTSDVTQPPNAASAPETQITLRTATGAWSTVAMQTFGGPAGQIAVMYREIVEERRWVGEERFLHAPSYCTLLPGPEAQQLATYLGWLLNGTAGGIVAGALFVLPGYIVPEYEVRFVFSSTSVESTHWSIEPISGAARSFGSRTRAKHASTNRSACST